MNLYFAIAEMKMSLVSIWIRDKYTINADNFFNHYGDKIMEIY